MGSNLISQVLLDQYQVIEFISSGGMGAVYRVLDLRRNSYLAMKVLHAELADDPSILKRFKREARALGKLAHPNIVPFYGIFQARDFFFLLEKYIDGPTLKQIIFEKPGKRLSIFETLTFLKALCAALGYAHANGVVHCDVKPGNVMVDRGGTIYLTDFGIARHAESTTTTLATLGTAAYMAPEQIRADSVSPATDVYALGVMLYEMLTGQRPFRGNEAGTEKGGATANERIRYAHQHLVPPDPRSLSESLPEALSMVILKALEKDPSRRLLSTQVFLQAACQAAGVNIEKIPDRIPVSFDREISPFSGIETRPSAGGSKPRNNTLTAVITLGVFGGVALLAGFITLMVVLLRNNSTTGASNRPESPPIQIVLKTEISQPGEATQTVQATSKNSLLKSSDTNTPRPTPSAKPVRLPEATRTSEPTNTPRPTDTERPTPSPTQPKILLRIAYALGQVGDSDIYVAASDGSNSLGLATQSCDEAEPAWSPDGDEIVYQSKCSGSYDLWIVDSHGGRANRFTTNGDTDEREPDWSPDGWVAYRSNLAGKNSTEVGDIRVINVQSQQDYSLGIQGRGPTWSPDGTKLAYMSDESGQWRITVYEVGSGSNRRIPNCSNNCRWPGWSPDGRYIIYNTTVESSTDPDGIWYISVSGGEPKPIISNGPYGRPSWSALDWLAFNTTGVGIEIIRIDGGDRHLIIGEKSAWAPVWSK